MLFALIALGTATAFVFSAVATVAPQLIPADRATPDWTPHWEKTFRLIEEGVFQKEDIACAIGIQRGLKSGANEHLTAGRAEQALGWFHDDVARELAGVPAWPSLSRA